MGSGVKMRRRSDLAGENRSFGGQFDTRGDDGAMDRVNSAAEKRPSWPSARREILIRAVSRTVS